MQVVPSAARDRKVHAKAPTPPVSDKLPTSVEASPTALFIWLILTASQAEIEALI